MCLGGCVSEFFDDGREEERKRVERESHGVEAQTIQPDFRVAQGFADVGPGKGFVAGSIVIGGEPCLDKGTFFLSQKFGGGRIVGDEEVGYGRDNACEYAFENEDPAPAI